MIDFVCYFFFPQFEMLSLALCDEKVCCKVVVYTSKSMKSSASAVCVRFVDSLQLADLSSSISNSANLF